MVKRILATRVDSFATNGVFAISGHTLNAADVVTVRIDQDGASGRAEACGVYYHDETPDSIARDVAEAKAAVEAGATRAELLDILPAGGARNAIDCALWDLEAKLSGVPVGKRLGNAMQPLRVNYTIGLADPAEMAAKARAARNYPILKIKLDGENDMERISAIRSARPDATLLVDANAGWGGLDLERHIAQLVGYGVALVEQPVPPGQDALLDGIKSAVPICADESIHDVSTLDVAVGRYGFINIKLDKAGGLTAALELEKAALARGFSLMTGCMLGTSLGIAPAYFVSANCQFVDLDSPLLLAEDRDVPVRYADGHLVPPDRALWG